MAVLVVTKDLSRNEFRKFQAFIYEMCGIRLGENKLTLLSNRLRKRLRALELDSFSDYYDMLSSNVNADELAELSNVVTTNETSFFRTDKHYEWLSTEYLDQAIAKNRKGEQGKEIRIWSAACSTGEEPYSIAIGLLEHRLRLKDWKLEVVGTDLSEDAVRSAKNGLFKERAISTLDEKRRNRYFRQNTARDSWEIKSTVREITHFQTHNLMNPWTGSKFDCIFLCNVMIYFDRESKQQVLNHLWKALKPGGFLVVGPSEGVYDMLQDFNKLLTFVYQK